MSEEGKQNLARFSRGEEPYLSLIRTTQLLDHLQIKGWSLRHITLHEYSIYLVSDGRREFVHSSRIEQNDYPYLFMMVGDGARFFELSNTSSSSVSIPRKIPSGRYRVEPVPNEEGDHELFSSYDDSYRVVLELGGGEDAERAK